MSIRMGAVLLSAMVLILGAGFTSECDAGVKVGYGWSVNPDETKAVNEAVGMMKMYVQRAGAAVNHALADGEIEKGNLLGGVQAYCRGVAFGQLGKEVAKLEPLVAEIKKEMNGKPFIGGFTAGEQGTIPGHGCFHGNLTSSMVVFSE